MSFFRKTAQHQEPDGGADRMKALIARRDEELRALGAVYYDGARAGKPNAPALQRKVKEIEKLDARISAVQGGADPGPLPPKPLSSETKRAQVSPCAKCGAALTPSDRFCLQCGQPTPLQRTLRPCPQCNRGVEDAARFCNHCGASMNAAGRLRIRHPLTGQEASFDFQPGGAPAPPTDTVEPAPVEPVPHAWEPAAEEPSDAAPETRWSHELERFARPAEREGPAFLSRGRDLLQNDRPREAAIEFEAAILQNPRDAAAHYGLGVARFKGGDTDSAIEAFERCIRLDRSNPDAHNDLGLCHAKKGQRRESLEQYTQALRLNPAHSDAHYNIAHLFIEQKSYPDAIHHLEMYLQFSPRAQDARQVSELIGRLQRSAQRGASRRG